MQIDRSAGFFPMRFRSAAAYSLGYAVFYFSLKNGGGHHNMKLNINRL
ncbi:hypothetical protein C2W63_00487 [Bacillus velezensis]|nr:hypothetical protein C2W63_00487 [Bacillus velezensis]RUR95002.1 hypothetical protein EFW57_00853 [Bacillus velezensis]